MPSSKKYQTAGNGKETSEILEKYSPSWSADSTRLILTHTPFARSTFLYAQEAGHFKTDDTYYTERENLHSYLIIYTCSGEGRLYYCDTEYTLTEGSVFFIDCMNYHRYETAPGKDWELLWLHFNGETARGYYQDFIRPGFHILCPDTADDTDSVYDASWKEEIPSHLSRIVALNQKKNAATDILTSKLITDILTLLLLETTYSIRENAIMPEYIKKTLHTLDHDFRSELSLDILSAEVGVSKYHLSREFKKYVGTTINEYLINERLSYAKELLKYSEMTVNEIVYACGMNHVSHFIRLFKEREMMTPLTYRKEWR